MPIIVSNIKLPVTAGEDELQRRIAKLCGADVRCVQSVKILRRSLDARKKDDIHFLIQARVALDTVQEQQCLARGNPDIHAYTPTKPIILQPGTQPVTGRIIVVGLGPAGLFCAHTLAEHGYAPLVIERGEPIERRANTVQKFWENGILNPASNVMFGEGGAGTFSDGKLTSRSKDARQAQVIDTLVRFGAPEEIACDAKPHIGTDRLRRVVSAMRRDIERLGGEVAFCSRLEGLEFGADGRIIAVTIADAQGIHRVACGALVLAIGQGARDTYRMLHGLGIAMEKKPFAVGVRIEHPQSLIDRAQFGALAGNPRLGAASYALTGKSGERGVYTFCMCPGGRVIASTSCEGQVVVNGMSDYARDGVNANAAVVVQVQTNDLPLDTLSGVAFQEAMERAAYVAGGGNYCAPAQRVCDFLQKKKTTGFGTVTPSYRPGVKAVDLWQCLPGFVAQGVSDGIRSFARCLKGFDLDDAVLTAAETETSAPLRLLRDASMQSVSHADVYPVGEGAGYAGGIVSAAIDGLHAAEMLICRFARP